MITLACRFERKRKKFKVPRDTLIAAMPYFKDKVSAGTIEVDIEIDVDAFERLVCAMMNPRPWIKAERYSIEYIKEVADQVGFQIKPNTFALNTVVHVERAGISNVFGTSFSTTDFVFSFTEFNYKNPAHVRVLVEPIINSIKAAGLGLRGISIHSYTKHNTTYDISVQSKPNWVNKLGKDYRIYRTFLQKSTIQIYPGKRKYLING